MMRSEPRAALTERQVTLAALVTAVGRARMFTTTTLAGWRLPAERVEVAELLVSELVTNAVKSTGVITPHPDYAVLDGLALLRVRLVLLADAVLIEVWDEDRTPPSLGAPGLDDENGRGLLLVDALSTRWDVRHPPGHAGKAVWCEVALDDER